MSIRKIEWGLDALEIIFFLSLAFYCTQYKVENNILIFFPAFFVIKIVRIVIKSKTKNKTTIMEEIHQLKKDLYKIKS